MASGAVSRHSFGESIAPVSQSIIEERAGRQPWQKRGVWLVTLVFCFVAAGGVSLVMGAMSLPVGEVVRALWQASTGVDRGVDASVEAILVHIRLPRIVLAALVGAALGISGGVLQGLFRNPLVEPGFLGVSSGAALGAVLVIVMGDRWSSDVGFGVVGALVLPMAAFTGAVIVTFLVYRLSCSRVGARPEAMLLAGIALSTAASAVTGLLTFTADDEQLRSLTFWMMGSLAGATWERVFAAAPLLLVGVVAAFFLARPLDLLLQGESVARHLGVNVVSVHRAAVASVGLAVGAAVSVSGVIGFVGLIAPHLVRLLGGGEHRWVLPGSALLGSILMVVADALARTLVAPQELPIGILTGAIGGPFFIGLLIRARAEGGTPRW